MVYAWICGVFVFHFFPKRRNAKVAPSRSRQYRLTEKSPPYRVVFFLRLIVLRSCAAPFRMSPFGEKMGGLARLDAMQTAQALRGLVSGLVSGLVFPSSSFLLLPVPFANAQSRPRYREPSPSTRNGLN